jgi:hypothetical protein
MRSRPGKFGYLDKKYFPNGRRVAKPAAAATGNHQLNQPTNQEKKNSSMTNQSIAKFCTLAAGLLVLPAASYGARRSRRRRKSSKRRRSRASAVISGSMS